MGKTYLAIVNPAAGGGRSRKLLGPALERLQAGGIEVKVAETHAPGQATEIAREAYGRGVRKFIAVGGDGTSYEIVNGLYPQALGGERPSLGFLPLGTGNSFLRDFAKDGEAASMQALLEGRTRTVDLLRLTHAAGEIYSFNLLSVGFTADVAALTNRMFKPLGDLGYLLGVFVRVVQLRRRSMALRCDEDREWEEGRSLFLSFNNSKYTGGTMLIAPNADPTDGLIEFVRWGPIGRLALLRTLPRLYDGSHIKHPLASRRAVRHVEFRDAEPVDVMIDGEVATLTCRSLDVVPGAVDIFI